MDWTIILVAGVLIVVLMWGPQKIPDLARSLGRARREFDEASKGINEPVNPAARGTVQSDPLIDAAQKLGISTAGKTRQQISDEIVAAAQSAK